MVSTHVSTSGNLGSSMAATCSTSVSVEGFVNKMHGCTVRNAQGHREAEDAVTLLTAQSQADCMLTL